MKAAVVQAAGLSPVYADFTEPRAEPGELRIRVAASALSPLTRSRASGAHYSAQDAFPFVPGIDGTGATADGRRVYFVMPRGPFGAMGEWSVAPESHCLTLPESLDMITAAAIANPGMSSWAALTERARFCAGETVLVNGATGESGQLAVQIARHMGAGKVIATGRNRKILDSLGADILIALDEDGAAQDDAFKSVFAEGVDVVLDYIWGASVERMLPIAAKVAPSVRPLRFIQIGTASGADIRLPGAVLRASPISLLGSGIGSIPLPRLKAAIEGVLNAAASGALTLACSTAPLTEVAQNWNAVHTGRLVFTIAG